MQIVRGGKVSRLADLSVIRGKTFAIVQQFETPYNKKDKNSLENLRDWRLIRENRKFSTTNDLHYMVHPTPLENALVDGTFLSSLV